MRLRNAIYIFMSIVILTGCSGDVFDYFDNKDEDGTIRFCVPEYSGWQTRGKSEHLSVREYAGESVPVIETDSLWLNFSKWDNGGTDPDAAGSTRSLPKVVGDMGEFYVQAMSGDRSYIDYQKVKLNNSTSGFTDCWTTDETYYWPEDEILTFMALCDDAHELKETGVLAIDGLKFNIANYTSSKSGNDRDGEAQKDFVLTGGEYRKNDTDHGMVPLEFHHPLVGLCFQISDKWQKLKIKKIKVSGIKSKGDCEFDLNQEKARGLWENVGEPTEFTQTVDWTTDTEGVDVIREYSVKRKINATDSESIKVIAVPFMFIPQLLGEDALLTLVCDGEDGEKKLTASLADFDMSEEGRMYCIRISEKDEYPPVEKLAGAVGHTSDGKGAVTLSWVNPSMEEGEREYPVWAHQVGVRIEIIPKAGGTEDSDKKVNGYLLVDDWEKIKSDQNNLPKLFDSDKIILKGADGNEIEINFSSSYDEYECHVYAEYVNDKDEGESKGLHESILKSITLKTELASQNTVAFFIPGNRTVSELLDDDDKAAAAWFSKNFRNAVFVNAGNFEDVKTKTGFKTLWFPCGVKLTGYNNKGSAQAVSEANQYLATNTVFENGNVKNVFRLEGQPQTHEKIVNAKGAYNADDGTIKVCPDYVTEDDCKTIFKFYRGGGNLLLTTFAIEKIYKLGVIPEWCVGSIKDSEIDNDAEWNGVWDDPEPHFGNLEFIPYYRCFNELDFPAVWFINGWGHQIYKGLFEITPRNLEATLPQDYHGKFEEMYNQVMDLSEYPLLSRDAQICENNNVVWEFSRQNKSIGDLETMGCCKFIGTWGQLNNSSVGVAIEFYPNATKWDDANRRQTNGRCIAVGLGAYEFNNGMVYNPGEPVKNKYQSNVQRLTLNALEYLIGKEN